MAYPQLTDKPGLKETARAIKAGEISVVEAVDAAVVRIEKLDGAINALAVPDFERAYDRARELDAAIAAEDRDPALFRARPLLGVPMTVKESFDVEGLQSCWGHQRLTDYIAPRDSELVRRLRIKGAVILGKTNIPTDLTDWQSFNPVYGRTNNPHDTSRSPGGSSGGSAAAVASGMVAGEFGTDIGGSVRVPAHFCGVWGHKTSWGIISRAGHVHPMMARRPGFVAAHEGALSVAGPFARNAEDLAALTSMASRQSLFHQSHKSLTECRLLAITEYPGAPVDASVAEPIEAAIAALTAEGIRVDRISDAPAGLIPDLDEQQSWYMRMLNVAMARGAPAPNGKRASAADWFDMLDAQAAKEVQWARLFESYDFVLAPPAPVLAVPQSETRVFDDALRINGQDVPGAAGLAWAGIATFPNLPSTVLPIGSGTYEGAKLPCSMQVMGPFMADLDCIEAAKQIANILHG